MGTLHVLDHPLVQHKLSIMRNKDTGCLLYTSFNKLMSYFGLGPFNPLIDPSAFRSVVVATEVWKEAGWGTIIYLSLIHIFPRAAAPRPWRALR